MNIQLANTEEFIDGKSTGSLGQVLIRYVDGLKRLLQQRFATTDVVDVTDVTTFCGSRQRMR